MQKLLFLAIKQDVRVEKNPKPPTHPKQVVNIQHSTNRIIGGLVWKKWFVDDLDTK